MADKPIETLSINVQVDNKDAKQSLQDVSKEAQKVTNAVNSAEIKPKVNNDILKGYVNIAKQIKEAMGDAFDAKEVPKGFDKDIWKQAVSQIEEVKESIKDVDNTKIKDIVDDNVKSDLKFVKEELDSIKQKANEPLKVESTPAPTVAPLKDDGKDSSAYAILTAPIKAIEEVNGKLDALKSKTDGVRQGLSNIGKFFGSYFENAKNSIVSAIQSTNAFQKAMSNVSGIKTAMNELNNFFNISSRMTNIKDKLGSAFKGVGKAGKVAFKGIVAPVKAVGKWIGKSASKIGEFTKNLAKSVSPANMLNKTFGKLATKTVQVARMMILRTVIRNVMNGMTDAFNSASKQSARFNQSMSMMYSSLKYLQSALASALIPLINAVAPAVSRVADGIAKLADWVARLMATLTGQKTYTKAIKQQLDYADSLDKSSKNSQKAKKSAEEYKRTLAGFDEINQLNGEDESSSSDSSATETNPFKYEDVDVPVNTDSVIDKINDMWTRIKEAFKSGDFYAIGEEFSNGLNSIFERTANLDWNGISDKVNGFVLGVTQALNGFFDNKDMWDNMSTTITNSLDTIVDGVDTFLENFHFESVGYAIAQLFNSIINLDWGNIGKTVGDAVSGLADLLISGIENIEWGQLGADVVDLVMGVDWVDLFTKAGTLLSDGVIAIYDTLSGFLQELNWYDLIVTVVDSIAGFVKGVDWGKVFASVSQYLGSLLGSLAGLIIKAIPRLIVDLGKGIAKLFRGIKDYFDQHIKDAKENGDNVAQGVLNGIVDAFKNIGKWIDEHIFQPFMDGFKKAFGINSPSKKMAEQGGFIVEGLKNGIGDVWKKIKEKFTNLWTSITTWFTDKKTKIKDIGTSLITNLKNGIGNIWNSIKQKFTDFWTNLKDWFKSKTIKLNVDWDTSSIIGSALSSLGLPGLPKLSFAKDGFLGNLNSGQLMVTRENGMPEMVGKWGNQTMVANNDQIVEGIEGGVQRGLMNALPYLANALGGSRNDTEPFVATLDGDVLYKGMVRRSRNEVKTKGFSSLAKA